MNSLENKANYLHLSRSKITEKAQIWMQVARTVQGKKRSLLGINEHFSLEPFVQDAPNMGFPRRC